MTITPEMILLAHDTMLPIAKKFGIESLGPFDKLSPEVQEKIRNMLSGLSDDDFTPVYDDDLNDDGDKDVTAMDTSGDGEIDTVVTTSDSDKEEKDSEEEAKDILGGGDKTSTGKSEKELTENSEFPKDHNSDSFTGGKSEPMIGGQTWKDLLSAILEQRSIS